jgi:hypothetical protein
MKNASIFLLALLFSFSLVSAVENPTKSPQQLPPLNNGVVFVENHGQWDSDGLFLARAAGLDAWVTKNGITYDFYKLQRDPNSHYGDLNPDLKDNPMDYNRVGHVVFMTFDGSTGSKAITGTQKKDGYNNYFIGTDKSKWQSYVPRFGEVNMSHIYNGIDARIYLENNAIRYDLIVAPRVAPTVISMNFNGAETVNINDAGELVIKTSIGDVTNAKLHAYQETANGRVDVACNFKQFENGNIGFEVGKYNQDLPLIIDPLIYCTYLSEGGTNSDLIYDAFVNNAESLVVSGQAGSSIFPTTPGAYMTASGGGADMFATKFTADGTALVWSSYVGGSNTDIGLGVLYDAASNVFVSGYTASTNFPCTTGTYDSTYSGGGLDVAIAKLSADGASLLWGTYLGNGGSNTVYSGAVDATGSFEVVGYTTSATFPVTPGAFQTTHAGGGDDLFITKFNPAGNDLIFSTFLGGNGDDYAYGCWGDAAGNFYLAGRTNSTNFPTTVGSLQPNFNGATDAVVAKFGPTGSLLYSTYIGGSSDDWALRVVADAAGNAYVCGYTSSTNYPTSATAFQTVLGGNYDAFVTKLNPAGSAIVYSTYIGGSALEYARGLSVDINGNAYITGQTWSTNFPVTPDAEWSTFQGGSYDAYLTMVNPDGSNLSYSTYFGGNNSEYGRACVHDNSGNAYVAGFTGSYNLPTTPGAFQTSVVGTTANMGFAFKYEINALVSAPRLMEPANNSIFVTTTPLFKWHKVSNAVSYELEVSTSKYFTTLVLDLSSLTDTTYQVTTPLSQSTVFYWHVRAHDALGNISSWTIGWNFGTTGPLPTPILVSPENGAANLMSQQTLTWNSVLMADQYHLQLSNTSDFSTIYLDVTQTATSKFVSGLTPIATFYWRVKGRNTTFNVESDWSAVWNFTIGNYVQVGNGVDFQDDMANYPAPSPYSNWYNHARIQFLYRADSLTAAGAFPGNILNFGWDVALLYNPNWGAPGPLYQGEWGIKIKLTTDDHISAWDYDNWTEIFIPDSAYNAVSGWNIHQCITPFFWDGVSNIKFETCFAHPETIGYMNPATRYATTDYVSLGYNNTYYITPPQLCDTIEWSSGPRLYDPQQRRLPNLMLGFEILPLMPPVPISPINNALGVPVTPLFTWNAATNAISYTIQVSLFPDFSTLLLEIPDITATQYQVPLGIPLDPTTQYYWHVKAIDADGNNSYWSFKWHFITAGPIAIPALETPASGLTHAPSTMQFIWSSVFASTQYQIQISNDPDFVNNIYDVLVTQNNFINTTEFANAVTFFWRVRAINPFVMSDWSDVWSFTTGNFVTFGNETNTYAAGNNPPGPYGNVWGGCKNQVLITAAELIAAGAIPGEINGLAFNCLSPNNCAPLQNLTIKIKHVLNNTLTEWVYDGLTEVYTTPFWVPVPGWNLHSFSTPFVWDGGSNLLIDICFNNLTYSENASLYYSATPDVKNITYYNDNTPTLCDSPADIDLLTTRPNIKLDFTTQTFFPPLLTSPANNLYNVSVTPLLTWQPVVGASTYEVAVSDLPTFESTVIDQASLTATSYQVPVAQQLLQVSEYFWHVRATDPSGNQTFWSYIWHFYTEGALVAPDLISPENFATDVTTSPTFQWTGNIAATQYHLEVSSNTEFTNIWVDQTTTDVSFSAPGLPINTTFYWRVRSNNPFVTSPWSVIFEFTTGSNIHVGTDITHTNYYWDNPAPYAHYYYNGYKQQYLYTADEILNSGGMPGEINQIGFDVSQLNTIGTLLGWTVSIKSTAVTSLSSFDLTTTGWTEVFNGSVTPTPGWNVQDFSTPFVWNGTSNVLVDICYNDLTAPATQNCDFYYSTTSFNSVVEYYNTTQSNLCTSPSWTNIYTTRPNTYFGFGAVTMILPRPFLVSPDLGATNVSLSPTFTWDAVANANQYTIQVSKFSTFSSLVVNQPVTAPTYSATGLQYNTQYYWRVKANNTIDGNFSLWSFVWNFTTIPPPPIPAPVLVSPLSGATDVSINPTLQWNSVPTATWYDVHVATDVNFQNLIIDNENVTAPTLGVTGLSYQTTYYWRVRAHNTLVQSDWSATWLFTTEQQTFTLSFNLASGWSQISSYINPLSPAVSTILGGVLNNITIMKDGEGNVYVPNQGINQIGNWNTLNGYQIKVNTQTAFSINGLLAVPQNTPIAMSASWNLVSYLRNSQMPVATALASLGNTLIIAKNGLGQMYVPAYNVNQIGNMLPGQGYFINVNTAGNLTYPQNGVLKAIAGIDNTPLAKVLVPSLPNTGNNASLIIEISSSYEGYEIGVWNVRNELIGSGVVHNGVAAVNIWGDDNTTPTLEGAAEGEALTVRLLNVNSGNLENVKLVGIKNVINNSDLDNLVYAGNSLMIAKAETDNQFVPNELGVKIAPNPFSSTTNIEFNMPTEGTVTVDLYTLQGSQIGSLANGNYKQGINNLTFDGSKLASGVYNLIVRFGSQQVSQMMIIVR